MIAYLLKRIVLFIPTLLVISLLAFGLSKLAPGDPVLQYLVNDPFGTISTPDDLLNAERAYEKASSTLNLDKPAFYFSFQSKAYPDTLYRIAIKSRRETILKLTSQFGNWHETQNYYNSIRDLELQYLSIPPELRIPSPDFKQALRDLYLSYKSTVIQARLQTMQASLEKDTVLYNLIGAEFKTLQSEYSTMVNSASLALLRAPSFRWHGFENQYHQWISSFIQGDYGISVYERLPVARKLKPALFWTLVINLSAIFLAFALAIPLGVKAAINRKERFDQIATFSLFSLYSLPVFWVGTVLLIFFTTREYGMKIFAGIGLGNIPTDAAWYIKIWLASPHLLLPVICITYPALAFIFRQMRRSMSAELSKDYIRTARAKGLPEKRVVWKHAFPNALFPVITLIASVFPAAIAGSVAIEYIFNIPGMGWLTLQAIYQKDWPIVFTVLMMGAVLTIIGMLVADILYALADPRVRYRENM
jgi:peptide/nickel transport system permease protein